MDSFVHGAVAGLAGTAAHSAVMASGKALGLMPVPAPVEVTAHVLEKTGIDETPEGPAFTATWVSSHIGYGIGSGVVYGLVRPRLPRSPIQAGLLFGAALWAISYFELLPKLHLYPSPTEDANGRGVVMALAHVAFGIAVAETADRLDPSD